MSGGICNPKITVEYDFRQKMDIEVELHDILHGINELTLPQKWNVIAGILNGLDPDIDELTQEQKELIIKFLNKQIERLK